ncbi:MULTISPECIES: AMP-dependent synthetase/ligase [Glutamicibacter]|uniref:Acyl-CoA synthetase n=1 Tax=Glutamicibacter halophytocola TaxID=1933880 RepID=A0AA94XUE8_9MICC|nr:MULTISPECIES: AMP-dependent synthetase/ligase [Glutamicibacter]MBF6672168.1 long-chain fatty acid--CoA ligase [Glutamicibacter sp. FBE19]NQD41849.1 long-chain fatty acid--CoA ligase [Glutamicibacter halophytocola]UUX60120.1 AMP-dependent synthetase/ligase [Glutamicibacter halophytocola]
MREYSSPIRIHTPQQSNITDLLLRHANSAANPALFAKPGDGSSWQDVTASQFAADAKAIAKGFIANGINPGARIALMAKTRYEWTLVDFAIWFAGCVTVPIYETSSPSQVAWIVADSEVKAIVLESATHEAVVRRAAHQEQLDTLDNIWQFEGGLEQLAEDGKDIDDEQLEARRSAVALSDIATIIYTSGTTGRPKGCELTHGNFVELAENAAASLPQAVYPGASTIMFLPLAHVFARFISVINVAAGCRTGHTPDVKNLLGDLQSFKPNFILAVPRVFEKVYNSAMLKAEDGGKGKIFHAGVDVAVAYSKAQQAGKIPLALNLKHKLFDALLYKKLREAMGGNIRHAVSGGGPLGERLGHFFNGIGVTVLEGYGLTETTAPITVNTLERIKIGTVGKPLPGNAVRIAEDGEILAKGLCVMRGYHNRPELQEETFTDGWFHTGDIGELDADGFLKITGRKKEIIVTSSGKNVIPALLEDQIRADALVSQCVVIGEGRPFIAALVTLDPEALPGWLERHQLDKNTSLEELATHPTVLETVEKVIAKANTSVSKAEAIKSFRVVPADFTEETGHLTPSMKIKRAVVLKDYNELIEEIYSAPKPTA